MLTVWIKCSSVWVTKFRGSALWGHMKTKTGTNIKTNIDFSRLYVSNDLHLETSLNLFLITAYAVIISLLTDEENKNITSCLRPLI